MKLLHQKESWAASVKLPGKTYPAKHPGYLTYLNYLSAISLYLMNGSDGLDQMLEDAAMRSKALLETGSKYFTTVDPDKVRTHLFKAWNTESYTYRSLELHSGSFGAGAVLWSFVQLWYSVTWAASPVLLSVFGRIPENHNGMVRSLNELACQRKLIPAPWNYSCAGDSGGLVFKPLDDLANGSPAKAFSVLISPDPDNSGAYVRSFISSTHKRRLDRKREDWLKKNPEAKRYPSDEKASAVRNLRDTTLFDALYRLREKSNYRDNESFLWDLDRLDPSSDFGPSISIIFQSLMMNLEVLTTAVIGDDALQDLRDEFGQWAGEEHAQHVERRARILDGIDRR